MSGERTERATPRRRQKASDKGDRVRSRELVAATGMIAGVLVLGKVGEQLANRWVAAYQAFLSLASTSAWQSDRSGQTLLNIRQVTITALTPLPLLLAAVAGTALFVSVAQSGGVQVNAEALQPKWGRINPASNFKNLISLRGLARLGKSLLPAIPLLMLAIRKIEEQSTIAPLSTARLFGMWDAIYSILLDAGWVLFLWSAVDYLVEWRSWESRQKMTKQEVRDEFRQTEANPQIRGRIRSLRRQMRRRKLRADVTLASVVVTNPTHYAVALSFDFNTMEPPKVLAKGQNLLAEQIKNEARWAGVPIVENPPLARSLYRYVEPGHSIPVHLYAAVASILAFLYRQQVEERIRRERNRERAADVGGPVTVLAPKSAGHREEKP
jgi:flagellar biosynthetic protein FlhB